MKETNRELLQDLIVGDRAWEELDVLRVMLEDPEFAEAVRSAKQTLGVLAQHGASLDDLPMEEVLVTAAHRASAIEALGSPTKAPILRHGFWFIPGAAAAAVLAFTYMQKGPAPLETPSTATLGGANQGDPLPQERTGFASFYLGENLGDGTYARIEIYATDMDDEPLFITGRITASTFYLTPTQLAKLEGYERVWVVVERVQPAGHSQSSPGQNWER